MNAVISELKHHGDVRGFVRVSKAWYGTSILKNEEVLDRITMGFYAPGGGTSGEFQVVWEKVGGEWTPRLKAFDDGWSALFHFRDLLEAMAGIDGQDVPPDEFEALLVGLGIKNMTPFDNGKGDDA